MDKRLTGWIVIIMLVLVALFFIGAAQLTSPNKTVLESAAALALITGSAVAIERVIEIFWTITGLLGNAWWPLNQVSRDINGLVNTLNTPVQNFVTAASAKISALEQADENASKFLPSATNALAEVNKALNGLQSSGLDNQTLQGYITKLSRNLNYVSDFIKDPTIPGNATPTLGVDLESSLLFTHQALDDLSNFADSFKDNPGKKFISIFIGSILGLIVSWIVGLDVFNATLNDASPGAPAPASNPSVFLPYIGVALTGLVIGLGSNPTHEVIQLLQESKKGRRKENQATETKRATDSVLTLRR